MILSGDAAALWDAARRLNRAAGQGAVLLPPLLFFTDPSRTPRPWETAARLPPGSAVVYRHFGAEDAGVVAARLRTVTASGGVRLLIGLDADLADRVGADGVHLPERALAAAPGLARRCPDWMLTGAAHSVATAMRAEEVSAVVFSPVFNAGGPSAGTTPTGVEALIQAVSAAPCPLYALGGVTPATIARLDETGVCGVAAVGAIATAFRDDARD